MSNYLDDILSGSGGPASDLATTGAPVSVGSASPPAPGQVLTATSPTTAVWQSLPSEVEGGGNPFPGSPLGSIGSSTTVPPGFTYLVEAAESSVTLTLTAVAISNDTGFAVKVTALGPGLHVALDTGDVDIEHLDGSISDTPVLLESEGAYEEYFWDADASVFRRKKSVGVELGGDLAGNSTVAQVRALTDSEDTSFPVGEMLEGHFLKVEDGEIVSVLGASGNGPVDARETVASLQLLDLGNYASEDLDTLFWLHGSMFGSAGFKFDPKISFNGGSTWTTITTFDATPAADIRAMAASANRMVCVGVDGSIEHASIDPDSFIDDLPLFTTLTAAGGYSQEFMSVVWTGSSFLALGNGNEVQRISETGATATSVLSGYPSGGPPEPTSFSFNYIASSGGITIIAGIGIGGINPQVWYTLDDGDTWAFGGASLGAISMTSVQAGQLNSGQHGFIVTGTSSFFVATDLDMESWTERFNTESSIEDGQVLIQDGIAIVTDGISIELSRDLENWSSMPAQPVFPTLQTGCGFTLFYDRDGDQHLWRSLPTVEPALEAPSGGPDITTPGATVNGHIVTWSGTTGDALADGGVFVSDLVPTARTITAGGGLSGGGDLSANRSLSVNFGSSSTTACVGNDSRLSDDRRALSLKTATTTVAIDTAAAPSTGQILTAINSTTASWQAPPEGGMAGSLDTTGAAVDVSGAPPPTAGQVLTATDATHAIWQTAAAGDVVGPASSTDNLVSTFSGTTGKLLKSTTTPNLGTPSAATLTNATGLPISTGVSGLGSGVAGFLATPSSANLAAAVTGETGSGALVFGTSPTLTSPNLGTPSAATLTNATGLPISTGVSGLGSGVATFLATPSSANLRSALTDETGTGAAVFATSPTLVTPALGTPASGVLTNCTGRVNGNQTADAIATSGSPVVISSTAPSAGQVLMATGAAAASWQTPDPTQARKLPSSPATVSIGTGTTQLDMLWNLTTGSYRFEIDLYVHFGTTLTPSFGFTFLGTVTEYRLHATAFLQGAVTPISPGGPYTSISTPTPLSAVPAGDHLVRLSGSMVVSAGGSIVPTATVASSTFTISSASNGQFTKCF